MAAAAEKPCLNLPNEIWECIFMFCDHYRTLNSLSFVSKQFHSITNRLRFSLTMVDETVPFLPRLFQRFPNLTSLRLILSSETDLDSLLMGISTFPNLSNIKSLYLSNPYAEFPSNGLRALSKKITNLTSLTSRIYYTRNDLFFIADCFPLLEELNLSFLLRDDDDTGEQLLALPKLRRIELSVNNKVDRQSINYLWQNCKLLQEIIITHWVLRGINIR